MGKAYPFSSFHMTCGHLLRHLAVAGQSLYVCLETHEVAVVFQLRERSHRFSSVHLITCVVNSEVSLLSVVVGCLLRQGPSQLHCAHENQGTVSS